MDNLWVVAIQEEKHSQDLIVYGPYPSYEEAEATMLASTNWVDKKIWIRRLKK